MVEVYYGKLSMTKDKGCMFIIFTVLAVVHMIYTMMHASRCIYMLVYTPWDFFDVWLHHSVATR